ncbi:MAG: hypothetical protein IJH37_02700 [Clostridia bacterium]|nr:hypothetical protein [Clostridia bacterium]
MAFKKLVISTAAAMLVAAAAHAAAEPCDLVFTQTEGGRFIYCNNIEGITAGDLADTGNEEAKFIMNNEALAAGRYAFFGAFINRTNTGYNGTPSGKGGFDIDVDVLFKATEPCEITISRLGFEVPQHSSFFLDGMRYAQENEWGGFSAWASYLGVPIRQIDSGNIYEPQTFKVQTIKLGKGETYWLSELVEDYRSVPLARSVHIAFDFSIESGSCDVDVAALRSGSRAGDRSYFYKNAKFGSYRRDRQYKGISDGLNEVTAKLKYTIDDSDADGAYLPVTVYNHYAPEGNTINKFYTHLNPRADEWSYDICAESDMLSFSYRDPMKLYYYGSGVTEDERDDVYIFDTRHTDTAEYVAGCGSRGVYSPNRELKDEDGTECACNLANYGVIYNYDIEITNTGNKRRYVLYRLATSSNNLVWVRDADGRPANGRVLAKGRSASRLAEDMACLAVPAQSTARYTVSVLLAANYSGGMENAFVISDHPKVIETYETERSEIEKDSSFDGREYYRFTGDGVKTSKDGTEWILHDLPREVTEGIAGNLSEYRLQWTGSGYTLRPTLYDAGAFWFIDYMYRDMYLLDEDFSLIRKQTFGGYPSGYACANGVHYVEIAGTAFRSTTDFKWWDITDMVMPCWNYGTLSAVCDEGKIKLSDNGVDYYDAVYLGFKPEYIDAYGEWYYFADGRALYLSRDGLSFRHILFNEKIKSFAVNGGRVIVNGREERPLPEFSDGFALRIDGKFISTEQEMLLVGGMPYIPIRAVCEYLGFEVAWNDGSVTLTRDGRAIDVTNMTLVDDNAYAPLELLSDSLGYTVQDASGVDAAEEGDSSDPCTVPVYFAFH